MGLNKGAITGYHAFYSEQDFVILQVERKGEEGKQTFVFDGYESMSRSAEINPDIPKEMWDLLCEMQSDLNASKAV